MRLVLTRNVLHKFRNILHTLIDLDANPKNIDIYHNQQYDELKHFKLGAKIGNNKRY